MTDKVHWTQQLWEAGCSYSAFSFSLSLMACKCGQIRQNEPGWFLDTGHVCLQHRRGVEWKWSNRVESNMRCISLTIAYMCVVSAWSKALPPEAKLYASVSAGTSLISGLGKRICDVFATSRPERFSQRTSFRPLMGLSFNPRAYNKTSLQKKRLGKRLVKGSGSKEKN